jgi:inward rectifier potassium channel
MLTISWTRFFLAIAGAYLATNLLFAWGYLLCGPHALHGATGSSFGQRFGEAFFFSVQTLATIGYGRVSPNGLEANILVTVEALFGLLAFALATGLLFSRLSRPVAHIVFSREAVMAPFRGVTALMFRIANERSNQLVEVTATVTLSWLETVDGTRARRFHELALERKRVVFFPLHWVVVHAIDASSPLHGVTNEQFDARETEIFVLLTAFDETFSQTVHARSSYRHHELAWGARFKDMFIDTGDGRAGIDLRRIHDVERVS